MRAERGEDDMNVSHVRPPTINRGANNVKIAARPTTHKGIEMRSRLEAGFAQLLDERSWPWEYEPRAFSGSGGQYLPDFQLKESTPPFYYEVKPESADVSTALHRMHIILESVPGATLCVAVGRWHDGRHHFNEQGWCSLASPCGRCDRTPPARPKALGALRRAATTAAPSRFEIIVHRDALTVGDRVERLKEILVAHPGESEVVVYLTTDKSTALFLGSEYRVTRDSDIVGELRVLLGPGITIE